MEKLIEQIGEGIAAAALYLPLIGLMAGFLAAASL